MLSLWESTSAISRELVSTVSPHVPDGPGDLQCGGGAVEENGVSIADQLQTLGGDLPLGVHVGGFPQGHIHLVDGAALDEGSAVGSGQNALGFQNFQIPPDGFLRDVKAAGQIGYGHAFLLLNGFFDARSALDGQHGIPSLISYWSCMHQYRGTLYKKQPVWKVR